MFHLIRRNISLIILLISALAAGSSLFAYPVTTTIVMTFVEIPGDSNPLNFGEPNCSTCTEGATIIASFDSAAATGTTATYTTSSTNTITLIIPTSNGPKTYTGVPGTVTINTDGVLTANINTENIPNALIPGIFNATVQVSGLSFSSPGIFSGGNGTFSSPSSTFSYDVPFLGTLGMGTAGMQGTITVDGLLASPLSGISVSATENGTAPATQHVSVTSSDTTNPDQAFAATVSPTSATWLTLTNATGTTNGTTAVNVNANFSTNLTPGTYTASILVDSTTEPGAPITIPVTFTVTAPTPTITSISTNHLFVNDPSYTLTVTGTNFLSGATVNWNGTALSTTFVSATQLTAVIPASDLLTTSTDSITANNAGGSVSNSEAFAVVNAPTPTITTLSPTSATAGGAQFTLTVTGTNIYQGVSVRWNGTALATTWVSSSGNTQATATVPASLFNTVSSVGSASITAINVSGSASTAATFTVNAPSPSITSLSPNPTPAGGAQFTLTVNGSGFLNGGTVQWNGTALTTTFVSSSQLTATVPAVDIASVGTASVTVFNYTGNVSSAATFTISQPTVTITSLSPASTAAGGAQFTLTVNGTNFLTGATVQWNGAGLSTTLVNSTQLTATVPANDIASVGSASVTVVNTGGTPSAAATFTIGQPTVTITSLSPASTAAGGAQFTLTVNGTNFLTGAAVQWNGTGLTTTFVNSTQVTATVPANDIASVGSASVTVVNTGGTPSAAATFTIGQPTVTITSLSPPSTAAGGAQFTLTVNGTGFLTGATVQWNGTGLTTTFVSGTQVTATVPASDIASVSSASVTVVNTGGTPSAAATFNITQPTVTITSLSPTSTAAGGAQFTLTVNGTGFLTGATVQWNGTGLTTAFVSGTQVTATVPASDIASVSSASVTVVNTGGTPSSAAIFNITQPTISITSLSPTSATAGGAQFTLTVNGTNFLTGATVQWNGTALTTTFVSATQLTATVPAGDIATAGSANVTAVNTGGTPSGATAFAINAPTPTITSLSPPSATAGGAQFTLTVNGTNFLTGATVQWNGTGLATTVVSNTQVTAVVPASDIATGGSANITAINLLGVASSPTAFSIVGPTPTLTSLNPTSTIAGGAQFTLTVNGSGFLSGATVLWNTTPLTTTFVSSTQLTATVTTSLIASVGTASITAVNTNGSPSSALTFTISPPTPTISSLSPSSATAGGGSFTLTVSGANFLPGATVEWNGTALSTTFVNEAVMRRAPLRTRASAGQPELTATVPSNLIASVGTANITVVNTGGSPSAAATFTINAPTPTISSLSPTSATAGGAQFTLTVNGTGFLTGASILWNGGGLSTTVVSATQLTATVPAGLIASVSSASITAINIGGTASSGVTFPINPPTPVITSLSPSSATAGGSSFTLTVNGTGFLAGATVQWNGAGLSTTFVSGTQLTASVSAGLIASVGTASVTAINTGGSASTAATFTINPPTPTISSLSPTSATAGGAQFTLTVNGTGFLPGATVQWNGTGLSTTVLSGTQLTATVPAALIASVTTASVTAINAGGSASTAATFTITPPTPTISSLSPTSATAGGAQFTLTVNGTGFLAGATVQWNGAGITTTFVSATQLTATVPAGLIASVASASITAINSGGTASTAVTFPINPPTPTITSLSPTSATAGGSTFTLTVNGTGFLSGAVVQWNGTGLTTTFVNGTQLTASVPANLIAAVSSANITAVNSGGSPSTAVPFAINPPTPTITSLSPASATAGGAQFTLTVNGTGFLSGATVQWNGAGIATTFVSATQLTAVVPANLIASFGTASITAINTGGSASTAATFTINPPTPTITSLSPTSATAGGAQFTLTVNGTNFLTGATVQWNGAGIATTFVSATQLTATVPANLIASVASASITAINTGGSASTPATFAINPPTPTITSLSPTSATAGGSAFTLTVNGTGFLSGATVQWNSAGLSTTFVSATQLTASVPANLIASVASASIMAINSGGTASTATSFPINPPTPTITSLNPTSVTAGGSAFTLTVNGTGFLSGATVQWNGTGLTTTFVSNTQVTAAVPANLITSVTSANVTAINTGGSASTAFTFSVVSPSTPTITSLSPTSAIGGGSAFTLTVNGTNFLSSATVQFNGTGLTTTFVSATQLTAAVPANLIATIGSAGVTATNTGGSPSAPATFPIVAPTITSLSPTSATAGGSTFTLTVNGTNFLSGASVQFNGTGLTTTFVSATQLTATVASTLIASVSSASVTVINPGGNTSTASSFPINPPTATITSLSPASATAGGPSFTLTVNGTGFLPGAIVQWNGTDLVTTVVSGTQLTATVSAGLIVSVSTANVTALNNGGSPSTAATFNISPPTPTITSLSPTSATAGGAAFTLTVNGTGFLSGAVVRWNGTGLTTTFVSTTQLTAAVPANLIVSSSSANITAVNTGGSPSAAATFNISPPTPTITSLSPASTTAGGSAFTLTVNGTGFVSGATVQWNGAGLTTTFVSTTQLTAAVPANLIASVTTASVTAINTGGSPSTAATFTISPATPIITSLSPTSATAGGSSFTLTVNGTGFASGATVQWNGTGLNTTFVSATQLTATVSSGLIVSVSSASVTAVNNGGSPSTAVTFPINAPTPTITSLSPTSATAGGTAFTLTVNGTNFLSGATVQWNGTGLSTTFLSNTQLTAAVPANLIASVASASITAVNSGGSPSTATAFNINPPTPTITSLNPTSATAGGGLAFTLTVNGTNFLSGATVQWNGAGLTTTFVSNTQLTAAVPANLIASVGSASVTAVNSGGSPSATTTFNITPPTPTITSLNPTSATAGGPAFTLTVNGSGFLSGATVQWNGAGLTTTFVSNTQLTAAVSAGLIASVNSASVTAVNTGGSPSTATTFNITPPTPTITSLSPTTATAGGAAFTLTVNGTGFLSGATVLWNGTGLTTTFVSTTQLTAAVQASLIASVSSANVTAVNAGGSPSTAFTFAINTPTPTITGLSPTSVTAGGSAFTLTVNGTAFLSGATVQWNGAGLTTTFISSTQLTAAVPANLITSVGSASITAVNSGGAPSIAATFPVVSPSTPTISSLSPTSAIAGGAAFTLTVNGTAFLSSASVQWNGTGLATTFVSATQLTAAVPANLIASVGSASVTAVNNGGTASAPATFPISAPTITSLSPTSATAGGAQFTLTVNGTNFLSGATVQFNGTALATTFVSATQLTATVTAGLIANVGSGTVTVVNTGGNSSTASTFPINPPMPTITSLSPASATAGGSSFTLTVNGTGFLSGATVQWNGTGLTTTFVSATQLTATVSAGLIVNVINASVTAVNNGGTPSAAATFAVKPPTPTLTSLSPTSATAGGSIFTLTVNGTGFLSGATVQWNGTGLATTFVNGSQLTATVPANLIASVSTASITAVNNGGNPSTAITFAITPPTPTISSLSPTSATAGGAQFTLTVNGTGFLSGAAVQWNGTALTTTFVSATQLTATVPAGLIGSVASASITAINAGGSASTATTFPINPPTPTITGLSPTSITAGGSSFTLTVNGTGFLAGATVQWNGTGLTTTFVSGTQLTATVSAGLIVNMGTASITTVNNGGSASTATTFTITPPTPTIISVSPASATALGPAFTLTVNGTNFLSGATVQWNGAGLTTTFVSSTQVTAAVPANLIAGVGSANITAINTGGTASAAATFAINTPTPTITSLSPTSVTAAGSAFTLTVNGTGFLAGATVQWNATGLTTTFVSNTQVTAAVPANLIAAIGSASITAANTGGTSSTAATFQIVTPSTPTITSLSPASVSAGGPAFTLTVNGTNFLSNATVQWNGTGITTTFVSATQLTAAVPANLIASIGSASVTAVNAAGSPSAPATLAINAPTITSLSPVSISAGGPAFTLTVNGTGFLSGAMVQWNATGLTTTFVSATQLTAAAPANLIASVGSAGITVVNPGSNASPSSAFPINPPTPTITTLNPTSATAGGSAFTLTVNGAGFLSGATVQWNGTGLTTTFVSNTQLTATVSAGLIVSVGSVNITVVDNGGTPSTAVSFPINPPTPTITSLSPTSATAGGPSFTLTVTGTGFLAGATVQWNGTALTTTFVNGTQLTATVSSTLIANVGSGAVTVVDNGGAPSAATTLPVNPPTTTITSLSPTSATVGGSPFTLTVNGTGFLVGVSVQWNGTPLPTTFVSATQLTASVPASLIANAGSANITVLDSGGSPSTPASFPINAPTATISSLSPTSAAAGGAEFTLSVNGTGFVAGATVDWNSTQLATSFVSATQLTAVVPASLIASTSPGGSAQPAAQHANLIAATGSVSITVVLPGGGISNPISFSIVTPSAPVLTGLGPDDATAGGAAFTLTVNGTGFLSTSTVQWNGSGLTTTFVSSTQLTASVPANLIASAGSASVTVVTPGVSASNALAFTSRALAITTLSPNSANPGGAAFSMIVNGTGFVLNSQVQWNGTALATTFFDPTQLIASVPANLIANSGTANVTVSDPGGLSSSPATFTINGMILTGLSPASAAAGGAAFTLTITGTGFASGATVAWNGTALTTTFVSATQLTAAVPANLIATAGNAGVTVSSGGSTSAALAFPINAVTITSLSPAAASAGAAGFTLAVNGTAFVSGSTVQWNGAPLTTTFVSAGQVLAAVPASLVAAGGMASIELVTPTGPTSNTVSLPIAGQTLTITTSTLPGVTTGAVYSQNLAAAGGTPPYSSWLVGSGSLPPGLTLNASTGAITGTPNSAAGSPYQFGVIVTDSNGAISAATNLSITVIQPPVLTIVTPNTLEPGTPGAAYFQGFLAAAGTPPYVNWTVTGGTLPPGLTLAVASGGSGQLTGTPTTPGSYSFTVQVTDSVNATASGQFSLEINAANTITIYSTGIVNSASYLSGDVAPGELVAIFGTGMGPATFTGLQLDDAGNIADTLNGVQVLFDGRPAPLLYVSGAQIGAVVPYEVSGQASTQIQVTWQGETSNTVSVPVSRAAPAIYSQNSSGGGAGSVLNVNGTLNTPANPTTPGAYVFVYATGEGQTNPPGVDGQLNGITAPIPTQMVTATIGGLPAFVQYAGGVASLVAGVIQINLQVPQGVTPGNNVPLIINIGGATTQVGVTIAVQAP